MASNIVGCEALDEKHGISVLQQQQNNKWCDVSLFGKDSVVGIKGHKMILASASPHLRDAFNSEGFVDSDAKEYRIEQISHAILQVTVDFIYSSTLRLAGDDICDRLKLVLIGADYLLMPDLVHICGKSLANTAFLNVSSAVDMWLFARKYHCNVLENAAVCAMVSDLRNIADQDDYLNVNKADVAAMLKSVAAQPAVLPDLICEAAVAWLGYVKDERRADCDEVMRQVSLNEVSVEVLQHASELTFLSEQVLWAIKHMRVVRAEVNDVKLENKSLTSNLKMANDKFDRAKLLAVNRRQHLEKMISQAANMDYHLVTIYNYHKKDEYNQPQINEDKKDREKQRQEASSFVTKQMGVDR